MKRSVLAVSVFALLVLSACATTPATPSLQGTVTAVSDGSITITPASGQPVTVNVDRSTLMSWYTGVDAKPSEIAAGYRVSVWTAEGSQRATRLVIEK